MQLRSVSHAFVSTLPKHRLKQILFGRLHFRDNWGWPCMAVCMWLICSNKRLYNKKMIFLLPWCYTTLFFVIDSDHLHSTNPVHSHMYWGKICLQHSLV